MMEITMQGGIALNNYLMIVTVPRGESEQVILAAKSAGAKGAAMLHARGTDLSGKDGLLHFKVEPEEEIVLFRVAQESVEIVTHAIQNGVKSLNERNGTLYVLPLQLVGG